MSSSSIDETRRDEWRNLLLTADPAPWRFELGDYEAGIGHILTSAPADSPWTDAPILCSHFFGPRDAANYALMAAAPTAIRDLLGEVERLEAEVRDDMTAMIVSHCAECPFAQQDDEWSDWWCAADLNEIREIGQRQAFTGGRWLPPPTWCPLRASDRLVTLRAS